MKKMKKIMAAAIAMMTFSTAAAVTGTVAWFTASNVVSASGMSIQADTESGLLIANEKFSVPSGKTSAWNETTVASHDGTIESAQAKFIPTSTANAEDWYHANATEFDNYASSGAYSTLDDQLVGDTGVYKVANTDLSVKDKYIYLVNEFHLKTSTPSPMANATLYVNRLTITGSTSSAELNKALRVLVLYGSNPKIFAPFDGATLSYNVNGSSTATTAIDAKNGLVNTELASNVTIPASTTANADTLLLKVFIYFEGEDRNCKSSNIVATLDTLALDIQFGTQTLTA